VIENRYNQFRILYYLYHKHYEIGGWQDSNELLKNDDLKYIPEPIINADIEYLRDSDFIDATDVPNQRNFQIKIRAKGIDTINSIINGYIEFLEASSRSDLQKQFAHISAIQDTDSKMTQIYSYIKQEENTFRKFLKWSKIFERSASAIFEIPNPNFDIAYLVTEITELRQRPIDSRVRDLENWQMERKASFKYDISIGKSSQELEKRICKTIAGFLNTKGGILFIGVDDVGNVVGLKQDYAQVKGNNSDGFELELRNSIRKYLRENNANELLDIKFHSLLSEDIAEIVVFPSSKPIFLHDKGIEEFYVRIGNSTTPYYLSKAIEYCGKRFS
jgi:Schlafen, AlbA_2